MDDFLIGQIDEAQLRLLRSGDSSDLQIECQGRTWAAHKCILAQRCAYFRAALRPEFQARPTLLVASHHAHYQSQEHSRGLINLEEDDPGAVDELLKYLYTLSDQIEFDKSDSCEYDWTHLHLCEGGFLGHLPDEVKHLSNIVAVADKYCVSDLVILAGQKITERLEILKSHAPSLDEKKVELLVPAFSEAVYYHGKIPGLRYCQKTLAEIITSSFRRFGHLRDIAGLEEVFKSHPLLVRDLFDCSEALVEECERIIQRQSCRIDEVLGQLPRTKRGGRGGRGGGGRGGARGGSPWTE